jgi:hypothetical protein
MPTSGNSKKEEYDTGLGKADFNQMDIEGIKRLCCNVVVILRIQNHPL